MRRIILAVLMVLILPIVSCAAGVYRPEKYGDEILQALINDKAPKFRVETFSDDVTGLAVEYSVYLPEGYSPGKKYPAVFFIADASAAGKGPAFSLTQGYGALVWTEYDCIVIVPSYPEMILDDHNGFVLTKYVGLTGRFVRWAVENYSVDPSRVYATGQSMGCMTFLVLAAENPEMFTACLFVSGQWDIRQLEGLKAQKFIYIASAGDDKASAGQKEVIDLFRRSGVPFVWHQDIDARNQDYSLPRDMTACFFMTFKAGTTLPEGLEAGQYSEHMTSFDYAYRMRAVREWLLSQRKETNRHE